ncbi:hypothetical protein CSKR_102367 [Clonorchis sinensis]|uniref:Uncharacterized protein n=1 Tax=Clonorchis sinensis TaxID=79923 RepID=A0A419PUI5_CLOSI|nr:hypothetical protein CSKR_102367 [Clonorchis sinensis]
MRCVQNYIYAKNVLRFANVKNPRQINSLVIWFSRETQVNLSFMMFFNQMCCTQATSCFSWHDIRYVANIKLTKSRGLRLPDETQEEHQAAWRNTFSCLETSQTRNSAGFQNIKLTKSRGLRLPDETQEEHQAAWRNTFSCLETSQTRNSAGFQNIKLTKSRGLRLPDETQEEHQAAWRNTFSCLETSQTRNSAGFQVDGNSETVPTRGAPRITKPFADCRRVFSNLQNSSLMLTWARWLKWLESGFTYWKVRGSNPTSASRLLLSRLGQPGSISALVLPSGCVAANAHPLTSSLFTLSSLEFMLYLCLQCATHKVVENPSTTHDRFRPS